MKNIFIIGSTGQIGSELTMELRRIYGNDHVVAGYIKGAEPKGELAESGPSAMADVTDGEMLLLPNRNPIWHGVSASMDYGTCLKWPARIIVQSLHPVASALSV